MNAENIAYTNLGLSLHQDLVYYESPPGLQLLHCLEFGADVRGGEHVLLDGFRVAELLKQQDAASFAALVEIPAKFQKIHLDRVHPARMVYCRPHISVNSNGQITQFTWAPPFEGPLPIAHGDVPERYYRAYAALAGLIEREAATEAQAEIALTPGDVVTFNNRRMLHGRKAFYRGGHAHGRPQGVEGEADDNSGDREQRPHCGGGGGGGGGGSADGQLSRHLQGVYVNIDEFKNKHDVLSHMLNRRGATTKGQKGFHVGNQDSAA